MCLGMKQNGSKNAAELLLCLKVPYHRDAGRKIRSAKIVQIWRMGFTLERMCPVNANVSGGERQS